MVLAAHNNFSFSDIAEIFILDNNDYIIAPLPQNRLLAPTASPKPTPIIVKKPKITTLSELKRIVASSEELNLEKIANNLCFFTAMPKPAPCDILIFSDYPNSTEDKTGELFTGKHSELLDKMLDTAGLKNKNIAKANLVFWHPLGGAAPSAQQIKLCLPFAEQLINLLQPKILLLLGSISSASLANAAKMHTTAKVITSYDVKNINTITPNMAKHLWQAILNIKTSLTE
ncbi:uracil-DNA glycosylase family protein [Bartonella sp. TP]|uniref:uracil-DNA glycosylase family protein n=1 Tax=Bartonella sp. TP TaxID=3057550 RepID=UPI0025B05CAA|nr:uracil-DNA glycosylase family protein [Bartonella sp. TP]WJW80163.1 uracil-DNA glycosylase family protein [Bartonella sp. TP]